MLHLSKICEIGRFRGNAAAEVEQEESDGSGSKNLVHKVCKQVTKANSKSISYFHTCIANFLFHQCRLFYVLDHGV